MTHHDLIAAFETLAEAPDGVKRLRELVLQLAVRGKLVEQRESDGAAAIAPVGATPNGRRNKRATLAPPVSPPFNLPNQWCWLRLGEVAHDLGSKEPDRPFTYIDVGAIDNHHGVIGTDLSVIEPSAAPSRARKLIKRGSVIYSTVRPYLLNIAKIDREFSPEPIVSTAFAVLHPHQGLDYRYLYLTLRSGYFIDYVSTVMKGVAYPAINDAQLMVAPVPLPPLAEQHRIVARVDELMSLLDRLEAARATRDDVRRAARDAALAALRDAEDTEAVEAAWGRIAGQMDALFAEPEDVAPLRSVILELAGRGRLVPQYASERPMREALRQLERSRNAALAAGEIKASRISETTNPADPPFALPPNWQWATLAECADAVPRAIQSGPFGSTLRHEEFGPEGVLVVGIDNVQDGYFSLGANHRISEDKFQALKKYLARPGDLLITIMATVGRCCVIPEDLEAAIITKHIYRVSIARSVAVPRFLMHLIRGAPFMRSQIFGQVRGLTRDGLNGSVIKCLLVPIPPLPEQHRIVAKVDALMALCDTFEARLTAARDLHAAFAAAAVHHLDV